MDKGILNEAINLSQHAIGRAHEAYIAQRPIREIAEEITRVITHQSFKRKVAVGGISAGTGLLAIRARSQRVNGVGSSSGAQGSPSANSSGARYNMYNAY